MTNTIILPRSVVQQAISTIVELEYSNSTAVSDKMARDSKAALRAALEQPKSLPSPIWQLVPTTMTNDMAKVDQELRHAVPWIRWEAILAAAPNPQGTNHD